MEPLGENLVKEHIAELQREAAASRLVKAASETGRGAAASRSPRVAARWVSSGLMFVATRLDPTIRRPSYGRE
jgi:hypothetical protein